LFSSFAGASEAIEINTNVKTEKTKAWTTAVNKPKN
jgi:hypothetical protein